MRPVWFGPKKIGYGARPSSWQGWLTTAAFLVTSVGLKFFFHPQAFGLPDWSRPAALASLVAAFLLVLFLTYGNEAEG